MNKVKETICPMVRSPVGRSVGQARVESPRDVILTWKRDFWNKVNL